MINTSKTGHEAALPYPDLGEKEKKQNDSEKIEVLKAIIDGYINEYGEARELCTISESDYMDIVNLAIDLNCEDMLTKLPEGIVIIKKDNTKTTIGNKLPEANTEKKVEKSPENVFADLTVLDHEVVDLELKRKSTRKYLEHILQNKFADGLVTHNGVKFSLFKIMNLVDSVWQGHLGIDVLTKDFGLRDAVYTVMKNAKYNFDEVRYGKPYLENGEVVTQEDIKEHIEESLKKDNGIYEINKKGEIDLIVDPRDIRELRAEDFMNDLENQVKFCVSRSQLEALIRTDKDFEKGITGNNGTVYKKDDLLKIIDGIWNGIFPIETLTSKYALRDTLQKIIKSFELNKNNDKAKAALTIESTKYNEPASYNPDKILASMPSKRPNTNPYTDKKMIDGEKGVLARMKKFFHF